MTKTERLETCETYSMTYFLLKIKLAYQVNSTDHCLCTMLLTDKQAAIQPLCVDPEVACLALSVRTDKINIITM